MNPHITIIIKLALIFVCLAAVLGCTTFFISYRRKRFLAREKFIKDVVDTAISEHLLAFMETGSTSKSSKIPAHIQRMLKARFNRNVLIAELVTARKSFSGKAGESIQHLYEQF